MRLCPFFERCKMVPPFITNTNSSRTIKAIFLMFLVIASAAYAKPAVE